MVDTERVRLLSRDLKDRSELIYQESTQWLPADLKQELSFILYLAHRLIEELSL